MKFDSLLMDSSSLIVERAKKVKKKKYRYPQSIPMLTPGDFCKGTMHEGNGKDRCCMMGWAAVVFGRIPFDLVDISEEAASTTFPEKVLDALIKTRPGNVAGHMKEDEEDELSKADKLNVIVGGNDKGDYDTWHNRRPTLAKWWNRAMAYLGYTEGNPEA